MTINGYQQLLPTLLNNKFGKDKKLWYKVTNVDKFIYIFFALFNIPVPLEIFIFIDLIWFAQDSFYQLNCIVIMCIV